MDIFIFLRPLILLCIFAAAAITDAAHHKVYNSLLLAGAFGQTLTHWLCPGPVEAISLCYSISFIILTILLFYLHYMGGADVKMYMLVVYAYPNRIGEHIIAFSIILGAFCAGIIVAQQRTREGRYWRKVKIPMGVFIFAAAGIVLLFGV